MLSRHRTSLKSRNRISYRIGFVHFAFDSSMRIIRIFSHQRKVTQKKVCSRFGRLKALFERHNFFSLSFSRPKTGWVSRRNATPKTNEQEEAFFSLSLSSSWILLVISRQIHRKPTFNNFVFLYGDCFIFFPFPTTSRVSRSLLRAATTKKGWISVSRWHTKVFIRRSRSINPEEKKKMAIF